MPELLSAGELAEKEFERPPYLVRPIIPLGGNFVVHGRPQVGKTQFMLALARSISEGEPLFGKWPVQQGPVVMVQADMTAPMQQARIRKMMGDGEVEDFYIAVGEEGGTFSVDVTTMVQRHRKLAREIKKLEPACVMWDTLRKIHRLEENASATPPAVMGAAEEIAPSATHGFNHHDKKEHPNPDYGVDESEEFRGASGWKADVDTTIQLKKVDGPPQRVVMRIHKARTASPADREPMLLEMDLSTLLFYPLEHVGEGRVARCEEERLRRVEERG